MTWDFKRTDREVLDALARMTTKDSGRAEVTKEHFACGEVSDEPLHQPPPVRIIFPKVARV